MALTTAQARALGAPSRRVIVAYLTDHAGPVTVAELTSHLGLNHNAVRKHLSQLVAAGLVSEERERRDTPGRPRLVYQLRTDAPAGADQPYRQLAVLLATALATGDDPADVGRRAPVPAVVSAAGDSVDALAARFAADGFAPSVRRRGARAQVVLQHCPYADAAAANPSAVCRLHLGLAEAAADTIGGVTIDRLVPKDPHRAGCVVAVRDAPP
jgi:predicted ArsR family transcriptional regulator